MAFDTYMDVDGIPGESTAEGFTQKIEIYSWSWGGSAPATVGPGTTGISASRPSISSFNVMKKTDIASSKMFNSMCLGAHITKITVSMRKQTGAAGQQAFLIYIFEECMVESIQWSGSSGGDDTPTESVSFAFAKVTVEYKPQNADGSLGTGTPVVWDIRLVAAK